jgi:hypothetical protein
MKKKVLLATAISTLVLTGCAELPSEHFSQYRSVSMEKADILPTTESLSRNKTKVVIFTPDEGGIELAKKAKAGHSIATTLEKYLAESGVEIVDRKIAKQLKKELQLAESKGKSEYQGPAVANYAVTGSISTAGVGASFTARSSWTDDDGETHVSPAYCRYSAQVSANLKVYELPGLKYSETISIDDSVSSKTETRNSNCPMSSNQQKSLVRQASEEALKDSRIKFQNYFAPKAYVLEHRAFEEQSLFKLSAGTNLGFKAGDELKFYSISVSKNPLTGDVSNEEYPVTEGEVAEDLVFDKHAWVAVDSEQARNIKLGDFVKIEYSKGPLEGAIDSLNSFLQ